MMIPYGRQSINKEDFDYVQMALQGEFLTTGPLVGQFESKLEQVVGAPTVSVTSGTAALHCAYAAIDVQPGDEIITPPITFVATQATAALMGAKIVFADVDSDTANINPRAAEAAITSKTKAIVAVDYAGHPAELDELRAIADAKGIYLIEDAAHSIGSTYNDKPVGSIADLTTFSFFPTKNFTTGEGGAISSPRPELLERAKTFSRQGLIRDESKFKKLSHGPWYQEVQSFGLNYRLPDILCALGISQIKRLHEFKNRRREIYSTYLELLSEFEWIELPIERDNVSTNWHLFPIRVPVNDRRRIFEKLRYLEIGVQVNYMPAYRHPVFEGYKINPEEFPKSEDFYNKEISIPMHAGLTDQEIETVVNSLRQCY
jgi:dTDP-4-amino-4,6-dideoxygalactose transaminase